jgi:hypothetical protein
LSVAIGDLNGDAKPDLVTANLDANSVSVLANRGDGSFETKRDYRVGAKPRSIAIDDLNGNGKPDLVAANSGGRTVSVLLDRGDGSFQTKRDYRTGSRPFSIVIGDLNGDRTADVVTANGGPGTVAVLLNRGDGSLRRKLDYVPGPDADDLGPIAIGDLNGDRRRDLAALVGYSRNGSTALSLLINRPGLCNVQNVLGLTLAAAKRTLAQIYCRVGKVRHSYSKRVKRGRVISQKPLFGSVLRNGGKVKLVVSRGRRR